MKSKAFVLYTAGAMVWRPVGTFTTMEALKEECVKHYGFDERIHADEILFKEELDGYEMKYEKIPLPKK